MRHLTGDTDFCMGRKGLFARASSVCNPILHHGRREKIVKVYLKVSSECGSVNVAR